MPEKLQQRFRDTWGAYRLTQREDRYHVDQWFNLRQSLRPNGVIRLPGGVELPFTESNKKARFRFLRFSLLEAVFFNDARVKNVGWRIDTRTETFTTPQGLVFYLDSFHEGIFAETFLYDVHFVEFVGGGHFVVEAGGFVGDTALYYASKGYRVISLEPDSANFGWLTKNLSLNTPFSEKISVEPCALGEDGEVMFGMDYTGSSSVYQKANQQKVRSLSLKTILRKYDISHPYLLHLDVKGVEHQLIDQPEVAQFERVRVEYAHRVGGQILPSRDNLVNRLKEHGFTKLRIFKGNSGLFPVEELGIIDAAK